MNKEKVHRRERLVVCMNKEKVHKVEREKREAGGVHEQGKGT